jgi:hypothetical protein
MLISVSFNPFFLLQAILLVLTVILMIKKFLLKNQSVGGGTSDLNQTQGQIFKVELRNFLLSATLPL